MKEKASVDQYRVNSDSWKVTKKYAEKCFSGPIPDPIKLLSRMERTIEATGASWHGSRLASTRLSTWRIVKCLFQFFRSCCHVLYSTLKENTRNISTFVVWNGTQRWKSCLNMAHYQTLVSLLVVVIMYPLMDECRTPAYDHSEGRRHSSLRGINISCLRPCLWDTRHQQKRKVCVQ